MEWLHSEFEADDLGNRKVFGIIIEAKVIDPGISAFFVISCSDGTIIEDEFVYRLNPCEAVGGLVRLELTPNNRVGARRFKLVDDMLKVHEAKLKHEKRKKDMREGRKKAQAEREREGQRLWNRLRYGRE